MANKFLDSNGVLYLWQKIKLAFASASDMTQAQSDIQTLGTSKAPIASPTFSGTPTAPTPAATDNSTRIATTAFVASAVAQMQTLGVEVVQTLPATGTANTLYFVPHTGSGTNNVYDEYMYISDGTTGAWEKIGTTDVDLSGYMRTTDMVAITNAEIDTIVAS